MRTMLTMLCICVSLLVAATPTDHPKKTLTVSVNEAGLVWVGRDTVSTENLGRYLQDRLFKSYLGTGEMYDAIWFEKTSSSVPDAIAVAVVAAIKEGQEKALTELCLQKFKKRFENIDGSQQDRIRKKFPVLFQTQFLQTPGV